MYTCTYVYIYIYIYMCICIHIIMYTYAYTLMNMSHVNNHGHKLCHVPMRHVAHEYNTLSGDDVTLAMYIHDHITHEKTL